MNKFTIWMKNHDKKQNRVAEKLGISTATLHGILHRGRMPSIIVAYQIELYTKGTISLYDWIDEKKAVQPTPISCT